MEFEPNKRQIDVLRKVRKLVDNYVKPNSQGNWPESTASPVLLFKTPTILIRRPSCSREDY